MNHCESFEALEKNYSPYSCFFLMNYHVTQLITKSHPIWLSGRVE